MLDNSMKIGVVGDIFLCRGIETICQTEGYDYPFRQIAETMRAYDITFANLENPISERGVAAKKDPWITFRAKPESVHALKYAGIDIVSLANNHMNDYGKDALLDTIDILKDNDILSVGAGLNEEHARKAVVIEKNNTRIAFLAFHHLFGHTIKPATSTSPGLAPLVEKQCIDEIKKAKAHSDIVIVSVHWGVDYYNYPSPYYIQLSRSFVDAGCNIVIGHHPHVLQGYEKYNEGLIFYSLGNFVFDDPNPLTKLTAILSVTIENRKIASYKIIPVYDDGSHQIKIAKGEIEEKIMVRMHNLSSDYKKKEWQGKFREDPTDYLLWKSFKTLKDGGSIQHLRCFPLRIVLQRALPLLFFKIRQLLNHRK